MKKLREIAVAIIVLPLFLIALLLVGRELRKDLESEL